MTPSPIQSAFDRLNASIAEAGHETLEVDRRFAEREQRLKRLQDRETRREVAEPFQPVIDHFFAGCGR